MTTDLWMLVLTGLWSALIPTIYAVGRFQAPGGREWAFGNREKPLDEAPWVSRAGRAQQNLTENLTFFAILVLVAHVTGKSNGATALGATLFFIARIAHTLIYTAGLVYVRTAVFSLGTVGEVIILLQLLK